MLETPVTPSEEPNAPERNRDSTMHLLLKQVDSLTKAMKEMAREREEERRVWQKERAEQERTLRECMESIKASRKEVEEARERESREALERDAREVREVRVYANSQEDPVIPKIESWDRETKIKLQGEWEAYLRECKNRGRKPVSITQVLTRETTQRLIWSELDGEGDNLTEEWILTSINEARGAITKREEQGVFDKIKRKLRWNVVNNDGCAAFNRLIGDMMQELDAVNLTHYIKPGVNGEAAKILIQILISKVQPSAIREMLRHECTINKQMAKDIKKLRAFAHEWIKRNDDIAAITRQFEDGGNGTYQDKTLMATHKNTSRAQGSTASVISSNGTREDGVDAERSGSKITASELRMPPGRCCFACYTNGLQGYESHYYSSYNHEQRKRDVNCPVKWDEETRACYASVEAARTTQYYGSQRVSRSGNEPRASTARYADENHSKREPADITIMQGNDWIPVKGVLDAGATDNFAPSCLAPYCRELEELPIPMRIETANNGFSLSYKRGRANFNIKTETAEVTVLNAEVYIIEGEWPEMLIGASLLTLLKCMPHQALNYHGETIDCLQLEREYRAVKVKDSLSEDIDVAFAISIPNDLGMQCRRAQFVRETKEAVYRTADVNHGQLEPDDSAEEEASMFKRLDKEGLDRCTYAISDVDEDEAREKVRQALRIKLANYEGPHITPAQLEVLRDVIERNVDAFGCDQAACKLSKLTPMKVELKDPNIRPCVARARNFGTLQLDWLRKKIATLVKIGMLIPATDPTFSSACFVVPKKTANDFRMVVDMRPLNDLVKRSGFSMPLIEDQLGRCVAAKFYGTFDVLSGYDMLQVHADSQKYFGLVSPFGVYTMTGAPMGFANSAQVYSARMIAEVLGDLFARESSGIVQWLDDSLIYAPTFDDYITTLEAFLQNLQRKGVRLNVDKCEFITQSAKWCGRSISNGSWCFEDKYYDTITHMSPPRTADELAQALYIATWLSATIPAATELFQPLRALIEAAYELAGSRRKKKIKGIPLTVCGWEEKHLADWHRFRGAIEKATRLATYDPNDELCVLSDASDHFYAACLSQIKADNVTKPLPKQEHQPLFFVSGEFSGSMKNWHISQKEMWPVLKVFERFKFICAVHPRKIWVYNDHYNLQSILHPAESTSMVTLGRLHRWAITLSEFLFEIIPTKSEDNFFADCLSRWGASEQFSRKPKTAIHRCRVARAIDPSEDAKWIQFMEDRLSFLSPSRSDAIADQIDRVALHKSQLELLNAKPSLSCEFLATGEPPLFEHRTNGKILIPIDMTEKLLVALHVSHGHPSPTHMKDLAKAYQFMASNIELAIDNLCRLCMHCDGPSRLIRRPMGSAIHATQRSEVLHADYLYITRDSYLLVITDDLSRKVELTLTRSADSATVVDAITYWAARYGLHASCTLVTDGGSHFASQLISSLITKLRLRHHIVVAYSPWANGSAEVENKTVLNVIRRLCSEYRVQPGDWQCLLPSITNLINNNPTTATGLSPNQIYFGREFASSILPVHHNGQLLEPIDADHVKQLVADLQKELHEIAFEVSDIRSEIRAQAQKRLNDRKGVNDVQYQPGDYVWVSTADIRRGRGKTHKVWQAPYQIEDVLSPFRYRIRDLRGKTEEVHVQRLRFYDGSQFQISSQIREQFIFDDTAYEVEEIIAVRWHRQEQQFQLRVRWAGFQSNDDTWEPAAALYSQIPYVVKDFLSREGAGDTAMRCLQALSTPP